MIEVTIIIPIYKAEIFIDDCLMSIQRQSFIQFEVICVIDGSPDNSEAICRNYASIDDRFKVFVQPNAGVCAARNLGLSMARGEFVCFVDADDKLHEDYLKTLLVLHQHDALPVVSFSSADESLGKGGRTKEYQSKDYIQHIFAEDISHPNLWAMLFERKIIEDHNLRFYVGCIKNEDTEFFVKYMAHINKVVVSDYKGYYYRINPCSVMRSGLNVKSLTSIEAQKRMSDYLVERGIYDADNYLLSNSVQVYVLSAARNNHIEIYDYLHEKYDVGLHMKKDLHHPRIVRKCVSLAYLLLGRKLFYKILSLAKY